MKIRVSETGGELDFESPEEVRGLALIVKIYMENFHEGKEEPGSELHKADELADLLNRKLN